MHMCHGNVSAVTYSTAVDFCPSTFLAGLGSHPCPDVFYPVQRGTFCRTPNTAYMWFEYKSLMGLESLPFSGLVPLHISWSSTHSICGSIHTTVLAGHSSEQHLSIRFKC